MAAFPSVGIQSMTMRLLSATAISQSPFTYDQQVYQHQGVRWEAEVTLPPMKRADAKQLLIPLPLAIRCIIQRLQGRARAL